MSLCILSLNVNGIRNYLKRRAIFNYCRSRAQLICLQETHSCKNDEVGWELEWGNKIYFAHGETNARGVCVLIKRGLDIQMVETSSSPEGRYIIMEATYNYHTFMIANIYAPNNDCPSFFGKLFNTVINNADDKIIIGDYNTVLDKQVDRKGELCNNDKAKEVIVDAMEKYSFTEVWRDRNPGVNQFTYYRKKPKLSASRLDYALVTRGLDRQIMSCFYIPSILTDHKSFFISIGFKEIDKGSGFWMFNDSLLQDETYVKEMNELLEQISSKYTEVEPKQRWELIKFESANFSQEYSRNRAGEKKLIISQLYEQLDELGNKLDDNTNERNLDLYQRTKTDLEELEKEHTAAVIFRCKARWVLESERNTAYFYSLEKARHKARTCAVLINDRGVMIKGTQQILQLQKDFYQKLYTSDKTIQFQPKVKCPQITENQRNEMESKITIDELEQSLKQMANGKTPGQDGLSVAFYRKFWSKLKDSYHQAIEAGLNEQKLHDSAWRGIINLIPKAKRDSRRLKNLRPITLLTVDFKILEKALANRLKDKMDNIIANTQTGFLAGRSISVNIRKAFEIIQQTEEEAAAIFIDFQKAFDKIEYKALYGTLELFGIGPNYIQMIKTCYENFTTVVQNNGLFSKPFLVERGLRQGAPNSSFLFLLCAEILSLSLKNNKIEGIPINEILQLLSQFADDMDTYIKAKESCFEALFAELEEFRRSTGLTVNYEKTSVYRLGSLRNTNAKYYTQKQLFWTNDPVNVLGVNVCYDNDEALKTNYIPLMEKTKAILENWKRRNLSILGRISIVNTLVASLFVYKMTVLPNIPENLIVQIEKDIINFIWSGRKPKISKLILCTNKSCGGAELVDLRTKEKSLKITWIKILDQNPQFEQLIYSYLKYPLGKNIWRCSLEKHDIGNSINSDKYKFWHQVIKAWCEYNYPSHNVEPEHEIIWLNSRIRIQDKPFCWTAPMNKGLWTVGQLYPKGQLISAIKASIEYNLDFMQLNGIIASIPSEWKHHLKQIKTPRQPKYQYDILLNELHVASRTYKQLIVNKLIMKEKHRAWEALLAKNLSYSDFQANIWKSVKVTIITKFRSFQYRLIQNAITTNVRLYKWKIKNDDRCSFCGEEAETILHLFLYCNHVKQLWIQVEKTDGEI